MAYDPKDPKIGRHMTSFEEPDLILMKLAGAISTEEGREITGRHVLWGRDRKLVFFLIDATELERIPPDVRRMATDSLKEMPVRGMAVYGAPLKARVLIKLVLTALNLISSEADKNPTVFFEDEAQARTWLANRRREMQDAA